MAKLESRSPDYRIRAKQRNGAAGGTVGVGWKNENGSFSIALNVGIVLKWDDDLIITAFPIDKGEEA